MPLQLPPLPEYEPSWATFQVWWQQVKAAIEENEQAQAIILDTLEEALTSAGGVGDQVAILGSYTVPTLVLTAADVGSDVTITIAAHIRQYANQTALAVAGGSITGLAFSTTYAVYYDDETLLEPNPAYFATTDLETGQHNYAAGRHYVGTVTTPANGAGNTTGGSPPAGSGYTAGAGSINIT